MTASGQPRSSGSETANPLEASYPRGHAAIGIYRRTKAWPKVRHLADVTIDELRDLLIRPIILAIATMKEEIMAALDLTQLTADVSADTDAVNSAVTLLSTLAAELTANANDPAAVAALAAQLETNTASLAAAVTANTPAAPAAPAA